LRLEENFVPLNSSITRRTEHEIPKLRQCSALAVTLSDILVIIKLFIMNSLSNIIDQSQLHQASKDYKDFMKWFKEKHLELHDKYGRNIKIPLRPGDGVGISSDFKISKEEQSMISEVAKKYYLSDK
jgi:hypothetical protein